MMLGLVLPRWRGAVSQRRLVVAVWRYGTDQLWFGVLILRRVLYSIFPYTAGPPKL